MKKIILIGGLLLLAAGSQATITWDAVNNGGFTATAITDGNPVGIFSTYTLGTAEDLTSATVWYTLTGGRAGDLVGYLILDDNGTTASYQLFNRPGVSESDPFGSLADSSALSVSSGSPTELLGQGTIGAANLSVGAGSTWTLYLADLSGGPGSTSTLGNWGLTFNVVPEPATWALLIFGGLVGGTLLVRRRPTV